VNSDSRAYALLRERDSLRRTRQVWLAGLVIWGVVVGWVVWGFINSLTDDLDLWLVWSLVWLLPVLVLLGGTLLTQRRLRACQARMVANERGH
jgi:hypothetical protein